MTNSTRNYYTPSNYADHSTFGGTIYLSDFATDYVGKSQKDSSIARRIMSDWKFDQQCKRNREKGDIRKIKKNKGDINV